MPQHPSRPDPARPAEPSPAGGGALVPGSDAPHPADAAHDLSDSPIHARSPDEYTEEPGSHRRDADGPALDVGG